MGKPPVGVGSDVRPTRFTDVLRIPVFAVLYAAETQSIVGDQLARVALSVLVFQRTGSAAATALTYAATYLPAIVGGFVLSGIGDRVPRRLVMIGSDVVRAGLFAAMAVQGMSTWALIGLLVLAVLLSPAFAASEVSYLAGALRPEQFRVATGLRMISNQLAQVLGFAVGGAVVAGLGPRGALLLNAGTYVLSALLVTAGLRAKPDPQPKEPETAQPVAAQPVSARANWPAPPAPARTLVSVLWGNRRVRVLLAMSSLAGLFVVPEGLAVPFGSETGATTAQTGLLLASIPLGSALGAAWLVRMVSDSRRAAVATWMAIGCGVPLILTAVIPHWPVALGLWGVSGALAAYQAELFPSITQAIPNEILSRAVGVTSSLLLGVQGLGLIVFGAIAQILTVSVAIGLAGFCGSALAALLATGRDRSLGRPAAQ
jgi:hypothetical protein